MDAYAKTHKGKVRGNNEDAYFVSDMSPKLFIVADGMGGHKAGEVASQVAVETVRDFVQQEFERADDSAQIDEMLMNSIRHANAKVYTLSREEEALEGMGTTLTMLYIDRDTLYFAHVGDSRAYILKDGKLEQITDDHSLVGQLLRAGTITEEQARVHPQKNILTNAVGTALTVEIDLLHRISDGGVVLLCTDGLTTHLDENQITDIMLAGETLETICGALVDKANEAGGQDNITVVAVDCNF